MLEWSRPAWDRIADDWDRIPNAWLFEAEPGLGRTRFARLLVSALLCEDPGPDHLPCGRCPSCVYLETFRHPDYIELLYEELPEERAALEEEPGRAVKVSKGGRAAPKVYESVKVKRERERVEAGGFVSRASPLVFKNDTGLERTHNRHGDGVLPSIKIGSVRELLAKLDVASFRGGRRVVVISPAELMTVESSNALLKSLEEPPRDVVFILMAGNRDSLLPTIRSRCRIIELPKPDEAEARRCVAGLFPDWDDARISEHLAFHGGRPLVEETPEEIDARGLLIKELSEPSVSGALRFVREYDSRKLPLSCFLDWSLKWILDVVALGQGFRASYYPGRDEALNRAVRATDPGALFGLVDRINYLSSRSSISLNVKLQVECLLIEYLKLRGRY